MTMAAHTPTPWSVVKVDGGFRIDAESFTVAIVKAPLYPFDSAKEDAEFIAKACNAHDELVSLLREMYKSCTPDTCDDGLAMRVNAILAKVQS